MRGYHTTGWEGREYGEGLFLFGSMQVTHHGTDDGEVNTDGPDANKMIRKAQEAFYANLSKRTQRWMVEKRKVDGSLGRGGRKGRGGGAESLCDFGIPNLRKPPFSIPQPQK